MDVLPRLIATDLDGTLLRSDRSVSPRTVAILDRLAALGIPVVAVTGRPVRWLAEVYEYLTQPIPAICANGAVIYDPATETLVEYAIQPAILAEAIDRLRAADATLSFAVEVGGGREMHRESAYLLRFEAGNEDVKIVATEQLFAQPATKLLARVPHGSRDPDELAAAVSAVMGDLVVVTHSSTSGLVEMSARGVSKASGLAEFAAAQRVSPDQVLAFGDMPNDVPMLEWAGRAVVVADAHPAARAVAHEVTGSNDEDGVADYLEAMLDLRTQTADRH